MQNLTEKEIAFYNELKKDYEINGRTSLISTIFLAGIKKQDNFKRDLEKLFEEYYKEIFENSDFLMKSMDCCYVGKYKDHFWGTGSEGELYGLGKEIQNIPYLLLNAVGDIEEELDDVTDYFSRILKVDYFLKLEEYKKLCNNFGFSYIENYEYISKQSEEFNELLEKFKY